MAVNKQDIGLLFGLEGEGSISGESGNLIQSQLTELTKALNKSTAGRNIVFGVNEEATRRAVTAKINSITKTLATQSLKLKVEKIDATSAIKDFQTQLNAVLKTVKIDTGFTVTMGDNGAVSAVKNINADAQKAALSLAQVNAALKEVSLTNKTIDSSYQGLQKALSTATYTGASADIEVLRTAYTNLQTSINSLEANKQQNSQKSIAKIYEEINSLQGLMDTVRGLIALEQTEATEKAKANAEKSSAAAALKAQQTEAKNTAIALASVNAALKEIELNNKALTNSYGSAQKTFKNLSSTEGITSVEALREAYLKLQTATDKLKLSRTADSQSAVAEIYAHQAALQGLIDKIQQRATAEKMAVTDSAQSNSLQMAQVNAAMKELDLMSNSISSGYKISTKELGSFHHFHRSHREY